MAHEEITPLIPRPPDVMREKDEETEWDVFAECNRAYADGHVKKFLIPPLNDYLQLGVYCAPEHYEAIREWTNGHKFHLSKRFYMDRGSIFADGKKVGWLSGGKGTKSRYGRSINFDFTGDFFRPSEFGGATLTEAHAWEFIDLFARAMVKLGVVPAGWWRFTSIGRWDCSFEIETDKRIGDIMDAVTLPGDYKVGEYVWSRDGESIYFGTTRKPKSNRATHIHGIIYQYAKHPKRVRVEIRVPKVRNVNPDVSVGQAAAAQTIAELLDCFSPFPIRVVNEREAFGVTQLDFGEVRPEEYQRMPWAGHPGKTVRQLCRQGLTCIVRGARALVGSSILATPGVMETLDIPIGSHDRWHIENKENLSYDIDDPEAVPVKDLKPYDYGASVFEIADHTPLNLNEIYEAQIALEDLRRRFHIGSDPFWVAREKLSRFRHKKTKEPIPASADVPLEDIEEWGPLTVEYPSAEQIASIVKSDSEWLRRYLLPYDHEPLRTNARWSAHVDPYGIDFYAPKQKPESSEPVATLPFDESVERSHDTASKVQATREKRQLDRAIKRMDGVESQRMVYELLERQGVDHDTLTQIDLMIELALFERT